MKVKELIEILQEYDENMEVHISYGYGDYWHTQVAPKAGYVEEADVAFSDYHRMDKLIEARYDEDEDKEEKETLRRVLVIG